MRIWPVALLALAVSSGLFAQQSSTPAGRFFGPMVSGWTAQPKVSNGLQLFPAFRAMRPSSGLAVPSIVPPRPLAKSCSVALLQMPIPKNVDPLMPQVHLPTNHIQPMPQANVPAPACVPSHD
jgi:hypothetical protein